MSADLQAQAELRRRRLVKGEMAEEEAEAHLAAIERESVELADREVELRLAARPLDDTEPTEAMIEAAAKAHWEAARKHKAPWDDLAPTLRAVKIATGHYAEMAAAVLAADGRTGSTPQQGRKGRGPRGTLSNIYGDGLDDTERAKGHDYKLYEKPPTVPEPCHPGCMDCQEEAEQADRHYWRKRSLAAEAALVELREAVLRGEGRAASPHGLDDTEVESRESGIEKLVELVAQRVDRERAAREAEPTPDPDMRPFNMQDGPPIPWFLAEIIHRNLYRFSQPLEMVHKRGGFGWAEVEHLYRENSSVDQRRQTVSEVRAALRPGPGEDERP